MKKILVAFTMMATVITAMAVPAKRGTWKTLKLENGTEVRAQLVGDEFGHLWIGEDGTAYAKANEEYYHAVNKEAASKKARLRRQETNNNRSKRLLARQARKAQLYSGIKKGLIILVNFTDKQFNSKHDNALFTRIANEENFSEGNFKGSMRDYFKAQSFNTFELDFDVVGPVTVSHPYAYYGRNDEDENDVHPAEMVIEAINLAKNQVSNWAQYDWDGDNEMDQVYIIYAGKGEADGGVENTIWPHAWALDNAAAYGDGNGAITINGIKIDTYACGSELEGYYGNINGIGTMCHEFSHCLGYPDYYDTDYSGGQGMGYWDLMDSGSYNGDGYLPAGYTSYERWTAGWIEPTVLETEDVNVENMKSLQSSGESYIIYNKRNRNEFFLLENRQLDSWDASLPGKGLLILHVDYNASIWESNEPNNDPNHQHMTWIPADNKYQYSMYMGQKMYTSEGMKNDPYPYGTNNAFNKDTKPAAKLYNKNSDNTYYLNSSVEQIKQNGDGTISFNFVANYNNSGTGDDDGPYVKPTIDGAIFYESFDQCDGKGGNDGIWSGQIANSEFLTDVTGWSSDKSYGANKCAKFGTGTINGDATTPSFSIEQEAKLTFRAGAWNSTKDGTTLNVTAQGATISPSSVTMTKGQFTDYEFTLTGSGDVRVTITSPKGRFFLDEIVVKGNQVITGINLIDSNSQTAKYYTLDGRFIGNNLEQLGQGVYIIRTANGSKKIVKR